MRYLVKARIRAGRQAALSRAIEDGTLGAGSIAGDEYLRDMRRARLLEDGAVRWVEVCFCPTPLQEELPYWARYFDQIRIKDAHARSKCRDLNGAEPWACCDCDCTARLEQHLAVCGQPFLENLTQLVEHGDGAASCDSRATRDPGLATQKP